MTLVVALKSKQGLVMATDSRVTIGDPRGVTAMNDTANKLVQLNDYCALGISGSAELANTLIDQWLSEKPHVKKLDIDKVVVDACKNFRNKYDEWFRGLELEKRPPVHMIMVGLKDQGNDNWLPRTYLMASQMNFAVQLATDGCMLVGVVQYAIYLKHRFYDPSMGINQATKLAVYLIAETATQDPKVGGPLKAAQIGPEGFYQLSENEIDAIIQDNAEQNQKLKSFFTHDS